MPQVLLLFLCVAAEKTAVAPTLFVWVGPFAAQLCALFNGRLLPIFGCVVAANSMIIISACCNTFYFGHP